MTTLASLFQFFILAVVGSLASVLWLWVHFTAWQWLIATSSIGVSFGSFAVASMAGEAFIWTIILVNNHLAITRSFDVMMMQAAMVEKEELSNEPP